MHNPKVRNRAWLKEFVCRPIADTARNRRYLAIIERRFDDENFGVDLVWLQGDRKGSDARRQTNLLGNLAFRHRTPSLRKSGTPELLAMLESGFRSVADHITPEGKFHWPVETEDGYWAGSHEHAWRLEPLLVGYLWAGEYFAVENREYILAALGRAAHWLYQNPIIQTNNRGAVWCAVLTLCGIFFEKPEYSEFVEQHAVEIIELVVLDDGEVGEHTEQYGGGGPDSNYSYTGWAYVYLYHLLSGKSTLDERISHAARWFTFYNTLSGCPIVDGASVRRRLSNPGNFQDLLPMWERLSHTDAFFAHAAECALTKIEDSLDKMPRMAHQGGGHLISPFIWAALESGVQPNSTRPDWHLNHTKLYERPEVSYALMSREYQTGVTLRGRITERYNFPLRGLQTWAYADEYPIVMNSDTCNSSITTDGIDTSATNASEVLLQTGEDLPSWKSELATLISRIEKLWLIYAFTPVSCVLVCGGTASTLTARWAMNKVFVPQPVLSATEKSITFADRRGRIFYPNGHARVDDREDAAVVAITSHAPVSIFAFSDESFQCIEYSEESVQFSDKSGAYCLNLGKVFNERGELDRSAAFRLLRQKEDVVASDVSRKAKAQE